MKLLETLVFATLIAFVIGACRARKPAEIKDVAIMGPNGQVFLFQKSGSNILIKQCKKRTLLQEGVLNATCEGLVKATVKKTDFRQHLEAVLHLSNASFGSNEQDKVKLYQQIKRTSSEFLRPERQRLSKEIEKRVEFIKAWGESADKEGAEELLTLIPALEQIDTQLAVLTHHEEVVREINEKMDTLIRVIMKNKLKTYTIGEDSLFFHVLYSYVSRSQLTWEFKRISEVNGVGIPASFWMGSKPNEFQRHADESPYHQVTIESDFEIGTTEVTQSQWFQIMGSHQSKFSTPSICPDDYDPYRKLCPNHPVESVSWENIHVFLANLNRKNDGFNYRLPSEAEWEYAARAGTTTPFHSGNDLNAYEFNYNGWYPYNRPETVEDPRRKMTVAVGSLANANRFGLYDMHGNVWEFTQDRKHVNYDDAPLDGSAWTTGMSSQRVIRGGSWSSSGDTCRSAYRNTYNMTASYADIGFRLVRTRIQ